MLSTSQILQLILLAAMFAAAVFILAGKPKSTRGIASNPLYLVSVTSLFLLLMVTEAVFSIYYVKFILSYGINAAMLSIAAVLILILPFSRYTTNIIDVVKSVPQKLSVQRSKGTSKMIPVPSQKSPVFIKDKSPESKPMEKLEAVLSPNEQNPEPIKPADENINTITEVEEKNNSISEVDSITQTEVENEIIPDVESNETTKPDEISKVTESQPEKPKPVQKSVKTKRHSAKTSQQKNTGGKSRGRKRK